MFVSVRIGPDIDGAVDSAEMVGSRAEEDEGLRCGSEEGRLDISTGEVEGKVVFK